MGNYNPNTPAARGMEERYLSSFEAPMLGSGLYAVQLRTRPGAVTPSAAHLLLPTVVGAPGIGISLVDTQQPPVTTTDFFPGSDTGSTVINAEDQGGAALNFSDVNDPNDATDYARNDRNLGQNGSSFIAFRGNNAGALSGRRILRVQLVALMLNLRSTDNAVQLPIIGSVTMGGAEQLGLWRTVRKGDAFRQITVADWKLSPATGIPWTVTEVDNIISAANADTMNLRWYGKAADQTARCSAYWLRVDHCAENRHGQFYKRGSLREGWDRYALASVPGALSANTWYWWEIGAMESSIEQGFTLAAVVPSTHPTQDPTDNTKDHRQGSVVLTSGPGGAGLTGPDKILTSDVQGAVLLETSGAVINADSQAYGAVIPDFVGVYLGTAFRTGQQVTTDSSQPVGGYAGVTLPVGWWDTSQRPTRPLIIEVRSGAGAINPGGGVLEATATLIPEWSQPDVADTFVAFDGGNVTLANSTQYHAHVFSDAVASFGQNAWRVPRDDSRSDAILSGSGTSSAQVQGATQGGTTDSWFNGGAADDRYDVPLALIAPPAPPSTVTVATYPGENDANGVPVLPPRVRLSWPKSLLTSSFGKYRVWFQPRRTPAATPILAGELGPDAFNGLTPTQAEANLLEFWFYELGWAITGGQFTEGWQVGVSVVHDGNRLESAIRWALLAQTPQPTSPSWLCSNAAPWLNTPLVVITREASSKPLSDMTVFEQVADRDHSIVHVPGTIPGRRYTLRWGSDATYPDEGILAGARAMFPSGRQVSLLRCRGDQAYGQLGPVQTEVEDVQLAAQADFVTTSGKAPARAGLNMPAGYVLDAAADRIDHADASPLDPLGGDFTFMLMAVFPTGNAAGDPFIQKYDGSDGWGIQDALGGSGQLCAFFNGSSGSPFQLCLSGGQGFDGLPHVIFVRTPGPNAAGSQLWYDGTVAATTNSVWSGSISTAHALNVGGDGGALFTAERVIAYGVWPYALTDDQIRASSLYLRGGAGAKMAVAASLFVDLRDVRTYGKAGRVTDLSGNKRDGTIVGSPLLVGTPWPLSVKEDNQ